MTWVRKKTKQYQKKLNDNNNNNNNNNNNQILAANQVKVKSQPEEAAVKRV